MLLPYQINAYLGRIFCHGVLGGVPYMTPPITSESRTLGVPQGKEFPEAPREDGGDCGKLHW